MRHDTQVRLIVLINHLLFLVGISYIVTTAQYQWVVVTLLCYFVFMVVGANIGLHRYFSHRSFVTSKWIDKLLCFMSILPTIGSPILCAAIHRTHHKYSDTHLDPHSPSLVGRLKTLFTLNYPNVEYSLAKDLTKIQHIRLIHRYYGLFIIGYCATLCVIDPVLVIFAYSIPALMCLYASNIINTFSHGYGYTNHDLKDKSTNNIFVSLFTFGEGWQNNHHACSGNWNTREQWWEFDLPALIIRFIKR